MIRIHHLNEGINHIEDLPLDKFLHVIENLAEFDAVEKIDGVNFVFGIDDDGKFYTTRSSKGSIGINYSTTEYNETGGGPIFAAAHEALKGVEKEIRGVVEPGEAVEVEIVFGRQPNSVVYGLNNKNYIAFLRTVRGTDIDIPLRKEIVLQLEEKLKGKTIAVTVKIPSSVDGVSIKTENVSLTWEYVSAQKITTTEIKRIDIKSELGRLRKFLENTNEVSLNLGLNFNNFEVISINLGKIPVDKRIEFREERNKLDAFILSNFKLPIKEKLLNDFNRKIKPKLQDRNVEAGEDLGVEGIVFTDPKTGDQYKLIDKETFTSINQFNYAIRKKLNGTVKTVDPDASLEDRGGLVGILRYRIMSLLGIPESTRTSNLKKTLMSFNGKDATETVKNFAKGFKDVNENSHRHKISAMIDATIDEINETLDKFKKEATNYKLKLKSGKEIGYNQEIIQRTLLSFAETRDSLEKFKDKINKTRSMFDLLWAIVGDAANKLFESMDKTISEELMLLKEIKKLVEDNGDGGGGGGDGGEIGGTETSPETGSGSVPVHPQFYGVHNGMIAVGFPYSRLFAGKIIRRIPRMYKKRKKKGKKKSSLLKSLKT